MRKRVHEVVPLTPGRLSRLSDLRTLVGSGRRALTFRFVSTHGSSEATDP